MALAFKKAVKRDAKLRLALCGPAGSGKTMTSLKIGTELGGPIAYVDTEHGSASKYADLFEFDVIEPDKYDPRDLIETIREAATAGYKVIVIDSLSHYWMGRGGELEMVDNTAKRSQSGNSFAAWKTVTPVHNELVDTIISAPIHIIVTMRTKTEWVIEENERGKKTPRKIGLAPVMRDGIEFEFDVCGDLDQENTLTVTKSRCPDLAGKAINRPGKDVAITLRKWLSGAPIEPSQNNPTNNVGGRSGTATIPQAQGETVTRESPERREIPTAPAMAPKPPKGDNQIPEDLRHLWEIAAADGGIEKAIGTLVDRIARKLGDDAAADQYTRLLAVYECPTWQELGPQKKAGKFIRDLWSIEQRIPEPPASSEVAA